MIETSHLVASKELAFAHGILPIICHLSSRPEPTMNTNMHTVILSLLSHLVASKELAFAHGILPIICHLSSRPEPTMNTNMHTVILSLLH